ncbi:Actin-2-like 4 [Homarus americanus]|uniref:Actin-2-like 4 n=1 Tax=Homarus americanus TaxID=6706 RepID=A0A8J5N7N6_HOMAM|nr:Actin-2-like 4 [Homarus americanus]
MRDTPSPGPPVETEKEDHHQQEDKQKREEDRTQQDRCVEVYPETVRQRQRNMMASSNKVDIKNWNSSGANHNNNESQTSPAKVKKFLPSVKALRNQFETGKTNNNRPETNGNISVNSNSTLTLSHKSLGSTSSLASSTLEKTSSTNSLNSAGGSMENLLSPSLDNLRQVDPNEPVEPIFNQFKKVDEELRELMSKPPSTTGWNPRPLLKRLYYIPEAPKMQSQGTTYINIEGYLEKLPSGRKKATFWNAWKRRYFVAKEGVLYYYQNTQAEKPSMKMTLMGGKVECMEPNMVGVDDGCCDSKASVMLGIDDGRRDLNYHCSRYYRRSSIPTSPLMISSTEGALRGGQVQFTARSGEVAEGAGDPHATLPQVFVPSVVATDRESRRQVWGYDALTPDVRASSCVSFPIRPSHKISKYVIPILQYSVDLSAVSSLLQKTFADLKVDPKNYHVQLSVPRVLNTNTQTELLRVLFDKYGVRSVNLTHQSILALYAYNATSGIVVDVGERMDIVPVIDGYIVDGGVSRVPYGGYRILDHLRQFLYMRNVSLINEVESYIIRQVLENICYCAHHYNTEKARCTNNSDNFEKSVSLSEYFHSKDCPYESISLDFGRFQATEGLFNPDAWGLDHPGLHKLVHKAIMECSMDIRKEMSRSIFLAGGVTQLPGLVDRLTTEIDNLTPPAIRPKSYGNMTPIYPLKTNIYLVFEGVESVDISSNLIAAKFCECQLQVHASPYRYHAAYIGACVLAESPAFAQSRISREDWNKHGNAALRKWTL